MLFLQHLYNLCDPELEDQLNHYGLKYHRFLNLTKVEVRNHSKKKESLLLIDSLWCSKYSFTILSVIFPVLQHPNPITQKWRPRYLFFKSWNSCVAFLNFFLLISLLNCSYCVTAYIQCVRVRDFYSQLLLRYLPNNLSSIKKQ